MTEPAPHANLTERAHELEHRAVTKALALFHRIPRIFVYHGLIIAVVAMAGLWFAGQEIKSAIAFSTDAGRPVRLKPSKMETDGSTVHTQYVDKCPAWQIEAATKKGRDQFAKLGIDPKRVAVLASYDIPKGSAPYGGTGVSTIDRTTGEVGNTFLASNPWLAWEHRFAFGSGVVYTQQGIGATVHMDFEPFSIRGPKGFRIFARVGADVDLLSGSAKPRASALLVLRRP